MNGPGTGSGPDPLTARLEELARTVAERLVDDVEAAAIAEATERVRERVSQRYARALEQAILEQLELRAGLGSDGPADPGRSEPASSPAADQIGWYLYAFATGVPEHLVYEPGLDPDFAVEVIGDDEVAAIGSPVRLSLLAAGQEGADLSPDGWLATAVRRHEALVETAGTTVIPMRFGTVHTGPAEVQALLARHRQPILDELTRLSGCAEWGVKAIAQPAAESRDPVSSQDAGGADYLRRKSEARRAAAAAQDAVRVAVRQVHEELSGLAVGAVVTPVQRGGDGESVVLNASYLVSAEFLPEFEHAVDRLGEQSRSVGLDLHLTGPWPPYHFVNLELTDDEAPS